MSQNVIFYAKKNINLICNSNNNNKKNIYYFIE